VRELFKIIWRYLQPSRRKVYWLLLASLLTAGILAVIPIIYGRLIDITLKGGALKTIGLGLLLWFVLSLVSNSLKRAITIYSDTISVEASSRLLVDYAGHFLHLPFSYLKEQKIGRMINCVDRASDQLERIVEQVIFSFLPDLLAILIILVILLTINWLLALVLFLALGAYFGINIFWSKKIIKSNKRLHRAYNQVFGDYYEYLSGYQTVKAFTAEDGSIKKIRRKIKEVMVTRRKNVLIWSTLDFWESLIFSCTFVGLFGLSVLMLKNNELSAGLVVSFVGYIVYVFGILGRLAMNYNLLNRAAAEMSKAQKIFLVKTENQLRRKKLIQAGRLSGEVVFEGVNFFYPGKERTQALQSVNFRVEPGESIALVGESGAGKSTLVDLILGYYLPTAGRIKIDGYNTKETDSKSLRAQMAVVPQEISLFHETISFNIAYGRPGVNQEAIEAAAKVANAHEFIMRFPRAYKSKVGERGVKLSVGQKQRIAIARALLRDPKILILDEATSSLDSITERAVQEALGRLIKGRTTFIIAHRLSTIVHADRIFVLADGQIAEIGRHNELLQKENGIYRRLYEAQKF